MRIKLAFVALAIMTISLLATCRGQEAVPLDTPTPLVSSVATPTLNPEPLSTPLPTPTFVPTPTPNAPPSPTATSISTPTPIPTPTPTLIPIATLVPSPTSTPIGLVPEADPNMGLRLVDGRLLDPVVIASWVVVYTNAERENAGMDTLIEDPEITSIAQAHTENMVAQNTLSNTLDGMRSTDRAKQAGYVCSTLSGIAVGAKRVNEWQSINGFWWPTIYRKDEEQVAKALIANGIASPSGRDIILDSSRRSMGLGVAVLITERHGYANEEFWATLNLSRCE